ncbi:MAG: acetyltransferase [Bacteroidetes bacterium]|nr:MAG: acetyltransferase [Bacteroidota bacterium]
MFQAVLKDKPVYILGNSGHAWVVIDSMSVKPVGYLSMGVAEQNPYSLKYMGIETDTDLPVWSEDCQFVAGIGNNRVRRLAANAVRANGGVMTTVIDASARVSSSATISGGSYIGIGARINAFARIGEDCIINTNAIVEHECEVGDGSHIAPAAVLLGAVRVGAGTMIGANSVVKEGVRIGSDVQIGAGSVVLENVPDGETWVGNPARKLNK